MDHTNSGKHIFTVDVENWYDGFSSSRRFGGNCDSNLYRNLQRILLILRRKNVLATFFWLGSIAETHKAILQEIRSEGHDIGCHGWSHTHIEEMGRERFQSETFKAINTIEDITGDKVIHYRAPFFSVTPKTEWVLPYLAEQGILFDSSIVPVKYWRYGYPGFTSGISLQKTPYGCITEVPVSTAVFFGKRIPISGGAWFRMLPYGVTKRAFERITEKNDSIGVFYIHPWELDTDHPCLMGDPRVMVPHYWNLRNTEKKLIDLLDRFSFSSMSQIFSDFTFAVKEEEN